MTPLDEWALYFSKNVEMVAFIRFVQNEMTTVQCKEAIRIVNSEIFIYYLLCAFGCYSISRKGYMPHLIQNPEALSLSAEQRKQLVDLMREAIISEIETAKAKMTAIKRPKSK